MVKKMAKVDVYMLTDNEYKKNGNHLKKLFSSELFNVQEIDINDDNLPSSNLYPKKYNNTGILKFLWCMENSYKCNSSRDIIFIRSDSVSNISPQKLSDLISYVIHKNDLFDIFYLCRWEDECQKMINVKYVPYLDLSVGKTYTPKGLQSLYITNSFRDVILRNTKMENGKSFDITSDIPEDDFFLNNIKEGNIKAYCTLNNVFNFDISQATEDTDFDKTSVCKKMADNNDNNDNNNLGYLWFIIVIIIAILLTFAIAKIGR